MIILIDGQTGSCKTLLMTYFLEQEAKAGFRIYPNYDLINFPKKSFIRRWARIEETYFLENGVIAIDDATLLLDAHRWRLLPPAFREKIIAHRHQKVDIYTNTQDFLSIDYRIRQNVHVRYSVHNLFRFPKDERVKPIIQITRVIRKTRRLDDDGRKITWIPEKRLIPRYLFVSRFWTRTLYNTYSKLDLDRFLCKVIRIKKIQEKRGSWKVKIFSRNLVNAGKARL